MRVFGRFIFVMGIAALIATPSAFAQLTTCDLYTSSMDSMDPAMPGDVVTYTITVGNNGPQSSAAQVTLNMELPPGVGPDLQAYLAGDADALAAFDAIVESLQVDDNIFDADLSAYYAGPDSYCDGIYLQLQDLQVDAGVEGNVYYEVPMPDTTPMEKVFRFDSDTIDKDLILNYGQGGCSDVAEEPCIGIQCLGPRIGSTPLATAEVELVDDGMGGTLGCTPPVGFTPGNAALIDRGECAFELKAALAVNPDGDPTTDDGASLVIIADSDVFDDTTVDPYDILNMACTDFCSEQIITALSLFVSWQDGQDIHAALDAGETVTVTAGLQDSSNVLYSSGYVWEFGGTATDTDGSNDSYLEPTTIGGVVVNPPVAAFTYDPMNPMINDTITFTDASTGGAADTWAWDFGDSTGTSADQNPTYAYAAAGEYTVTLTATNNDGSSMASEVVTVTDGPVDPCANKTPIWVAAGAAAPGSNDSYWSTDATINNMSMDMIEYCVALLPRGTDNTVMTMSDPFTLGGNMSATYTNVFGDLFAFEGAGAFAFYVDMADSAKVGSRTFNTYDDGTLAGTFGQGIPGTAELIAANTKVRLIGLSEGDVARTNIGFLNGTGANIRIMAEFFLADGTSLGEDFIDLAPYSNNQWNSAFARMTDDPVAGGFVDVWTTEGSFYTYASVVGNDSFNDPTTILP